MPLDAADAFHLIDLLDLGFRRWFRMLCYAIAAAILVTAVSRDLIPDASHRAGLWFLVGFLFLADLGFGLAKLQRSDRFWS